MKHFLDFISKIENFLKIPALRPHLSLLLVFLSSVQSIPTPSHSSVPHLDQAKSDFHGEGGIQPEGLLVNPNDFQPSFLRNKRQHSHFSMPMSFMDNFKTDVDWSYIFDHFGLGLARSKRSTIDESLFRNAMVSAILQRQLLMAEDHRLAHVSPVTTHHVSSISLPRQVAPIVLAQTPPVVIAHSNSLFKGYDPPLKGGSLEEIFGVSSKYFTPAKASYAPVPVPVGYEPLEVFETGPRYVAAPFDGYPSQKPLKSYKPPNYKGHPFSMEMVFGLPMHNHYMAKYHHLLPESLHVPTIGREYRIPPPAYQKSLPGYRDPALEVYKKHGYQTPFRGGSLEDIFGLAKH